MTIERFLNHIYYSFAAIDRTFSYSIDYRKENNTVLVAGMIMCFSLGGYVVAAFYTVVLFPMHLLGIFFSSQKELLMSLVQIMNHLRKSFYFLRLLKKQLFYMRRKKMIYPFLWTSTVMNWAMR